MRKVILILALLAGFAMNAQYLGQSRSDYEKVLSRGESIELPMKGVEVNIQKNPGFILINISRDGKEFMISRIDFDRNNRIDLVSVTLIMPQFMDSFKEQAELTIDGGIELYGEANYFDAGDVVSASWYNVFDVESRKNVDVRYNVYKHKNGSDIMTIITKEISK